MGRNVPRPDGYAPSLELYLREKPEGGDVLDPPVFRGRQDARNRRRCLVLVHGYNSTDGEAAEAYFAFRQREDDVAEPPTPHTLDDVFADAFWPGDAEWWSFFDKVDALVYPVAVHTAKDAASRLAGLLWAMPHLRAVDFVAHSLGCRVVLETLALLRARELPLVGHVCLMAAAVPSEMLEPSGRLFDVLQRYTAEGTRFHVLHSMQDIVLHEAFPLGQRLAGAGEASSRALGRFGPTALMPGFSGALTDDTVEGAGHSDYWGHTHSPASIKATELAGIFLELGTLGRRVGRRRAVGSRRRVG